MMPQALSRWSPAAMMSETPESIAPSAPSSEGLSEVVSK